MTAFYQALCFLQGDGGNFYVLFSRLIEGRSNYFSTYTALHIGNLLRTLIDDMQRRGTRAFLIHVPFAPEVEDSRFVRTTKEIVHEAFPDPALWLTVNPPTRELRWDDGIHLDERSALMVVRAIEGALAGRPAATPPR